MKSIAFPIKRKSRWWRESFATSLPLCAALLAGTAIAGGEEPLRLKAPDGQVNVGQTVGGYFFAGKSLQQEYDKLLKETDTLREEIAQGELTGKEATERVRALEDKLRRVRDQIDATKTFVPVGKVSTQTETIEFELGPEKLLFLADISKVRLRGWDGPQVKCVLEKTAVTDGTEPDKQLAGIRLVHQHGAPPQHVGRSPAELDADFQKMLATPDGQKLTPEQVTNARATWKRIFAASDFFRTFQAKSVDVLTIEGLTHQQGNRSVIFEVRSKGGDNLMSSMWQRDASLTVYIPRCLAVGVHGGSGLLAADGLHSALIVRGDGNRDFDALNHVTNHHGDVTVENIQLQSLENVEGDVHVSVTADLANSGTRHTRGTKTVYSDGPATYDYRNISGDFRAHLLRVNLVLSGVRGSLDVKNDFGDTRLIIPGPLAPEMHQVRSESGNITLQLSKDALRKAPLFAATECGTIHVLKDGPELEEGNLSFFTDDGQTRLRYRGLSSKGEAHGPLSSPFNRLRSSESLLDPVEAARTLAPGLDVINRAGTIEISSLEEPPAK